MIDDIKAGAAGVALMLAMIVWHALFAWLIYDLMLVAYTGVALPLYAWIGICSVGAGLTAHLPFHSQDLMAESVVIKALRPPAAWVAALIVYAVTLLF